MVENSIVQVQQVDYNTLIKGFRREVKEEMETFFKSQFIVPPHGQNVSQVDKYITTKEVAEIFGVTETTIHAWNKQGLLNPKRIGRFVRYLLSEIMDSPKAIHAKKEKLKA